MIVRRFLSCENQQLFFRFSRSVIKYKMVQGPRREISLLSLGLMSHIRSHVPIQAVETPFVTASQLGPSVKRAASYC